MKRKAIRIGLLATITISFSFLLTVAIILSGCREKPAALEVSQEKQTTINVSEFEIPVFSSAGEQLNYTRSWFANIQEKRATLQAFLKLFPQEKKFCGLAELDLAYLQLGSDYRFAHEYESFAAIKAYKSILESYSDFPEIMAKAYWYIGWIYSELLKDSKKGIEEYQHLIKLYPEENVTLLPPAPWVSIIYESDANVNIPKLQRPENKWAALALVEIIRHTDRKETARDAFNKVWDRYRHNVVTGFGLRLMLQKRFHDDEILKMAQQYMEKEFSNVHILGDIQKEINDISTGEGG